MLFISSIIIINQNSQATNSKLYCTPQAYVLTKFKSHDIVFLGTRHKQSPILEFISELITVLHNSGVTHIGLEIASDQQGKIDQFMKTGAGLNDIQIHSLIDCPEYKNILSILKALDPNKRPNPVALDLPKSKYSGEINRDEWMARSIAGVFKKNPNAKMIVVVGNNHVLKKLEWQDHVPNPNRSIRQYLTDRRRKLRFFSIDHVIDSSIDDCDFRERFSDYEESVAVDLDERFVGWKMGIVESIAIKTAEVWELMDGVIVY